MEWELYIASCCRRCCSIFVVQKFYNKMIPSICKLHRNWTYLWTNNQFSSELTTGQLLLHAGGVIWELMVTAIAGLMNCYSGWSKINCFQLRKTLGTKCQSV